MPPCGLPSRLDELFDTEDGGTVGQVQGIAGFPGRDRRKHRLVHHFHAAGPSPQAEQRSDIRRFERTAGGEPELGAQSWRAVIDAVLDTNVLISGYGWRGTPSAILTHLALGSFANYTSSVLLEELTESRSAVPAAC